MRWAKNFRYGTIELNLRWWVVGVLWSPRVEREDELGYRIISLTIGPLAFVTKVTDDA